MRGLGYEELCIQKSYVPYFPVSAYGILPHPDSLSDFLDVVWIAENLI